MSRLRTATRSRRRLREQSGASAVEFAIIVPLLLMLVFGIIDFGMVFNNWISVRQGSREGARQAVVGSFGSSSSCSIQGSANGANSATKRLICLTKDRVGLNDADTRVKIVFGSKGYEEKEPLAVCVQYPARSTTGFFSPMLNGRVLASGVTMRIEDALPGSALQETEETPLAGSWSCSVGA